MTMHSQTEKQKPPMVGDCCAQGRLLFWLVLCTGLFALSGASCPQTIHQYFSPPPRVLPTAPTLEQVIEVVNRNNSQIRSFSTNYASISGAGFPTLATSIAFDRPKRFRLRASCITGTELDFGSNDELFWIWIRRNQPPAVYYCRHDQFDACPAKQTIPLEPEWLIESLGIVEFDPALPHQLSFLPNDRLRIDTIRNTSCGPVKKVTILDGSQGWVLEQHLFDANQRLVASSKASGHRRVPLTGLIMPTTVSLNCPTAQLDMQINLGNVEINRLSADSASLWAMPNYPGSPLVDLSKQPAPNGSQFQASR
jgi:hypothetical protein